MALPNIPDRLVLMEQAVQHSDEARLRMCYLYFAASSGSQAILARGQVYLKSLPPTLQSMPLVQMYAAGLAAVSAKFTPGTLAQYEKSRLALAEMDRLMAAHPQNLVMRYIRASTTFNLPLIMGRVNQTSADVLLIARGITAQTEGYSEELVHDICAFLLSTGLLGIRELGRVKALLEVSSS